MAPFTHINPIGGRFSDGLFEALYIASDELTAVSEVKHHQQTYWSNIVGLKYDRFLFQELIVVFSPDPLHVVDKHNHKILDPHSYSESLQLARGLNSQGCQAIEYPSVRSHGGTCWALLTPKPVLDVIQSYLIEMIWDGRQITEINKVSNMVS